MLKPLNNRERSSENSLQTKEKELKTSSEGPKVESESKVSNDEQDGELVVRQSRPSPLPAFIYCDSLADENREEGLTMFVEAGFSVEVLVENEVANLYLITRRYDECVEQNADTKRAKQS